MADHPAYGTKFIGTNCDGSITGTSGDDRIFGLGGNDTLISIENVIGSGFDDLILGSNPNNLLRGGDGADELFGGAGNHTLLGEAGDDPGLFGGSGNGTVKGGAGHDGLYGESETTFSSSESRKTSSVSTAFTATAAGSASLHGIEHLFSGESIGDPIENHRFAGNGGANILAGGSGDDRLSGRGGNDTLIGLDGADRFVFESAPGGANADRIEDFAPGTDRLLFDNDVLAALGAAREWEAGDRRFHAAPARPPAAIRTGCSSWRRWRTRPR